MNDHQSSFTERLAGGRSLIGTLLTLPSPAVAEVLSSIGFDWLFIDAEHSPFALSEIQTILQVAGRACPCLVRIPANEEVYVKQVLDIGASGIIAPLVNTPETAAQIVRSAKYPPMGTRSVGIARAHGFGQRFKQYMAAANDETVVIIQVEHIEAVDNIEKILAVPGIDGVFLGPYDLSGSLGLPGEVGHPKVEDCLARVHRACRERKMPLGIFAMDPIAARPYLEQGYSLVAVGTDAVHLTRAASECLSMLKGA